MYSSRPVYTSPWREIGMNIFLVSGCSTKSAAEMVPTHAIHSFTVFGSSFTMPIEAVHTKSGAYSHVWKLKLKKNTATTDITMSVMRTPCVSFLPWRA